jgi:aspartate-semialdehyde dehydrogenase
MPVLGRCGTGHSVFAHPLPFNVIPHIDKFQENGWVPS